MVPLRCEGTMHAKLDPESHTVEVKCKRRRCGAESGVVVLHTFDCNTGDLIATRRFANPPVTRRSDDT